MYQKKLMVLGIYLFEMTTNENVKADGFDYVDGIYLFEMTTIENPSPKYR